jgi:hypothetical protein
VTIGNERWKRAIVRCACVDVDGRLAQEGLRCNGKASIGKANLRTAFDAGLVVMGKILYCAAQPVAEDEYAYKVARAYADFVHVRPFYEFHFARDVKGLWTQTPPFGTHWLRKWERKGFLTVDYSVEAFYCWLIEKATRLTYGHEPADTRAWIANANTDVFAQLPNVKEVKDLGGGAFIADIPRYQEFTSVASGLAERGVQFVEIAGNSRIILSVVVPNEWSYDGSNG